ncbi:S8 family serine peptidase [Longimicrobium sp.]|uniref:S8 family serine peptidase n=1 Tax=Longimicrobium sp. TaxID=2029185 RepID=UPI002B90098B|nr:S8 family serine peptidase [Longimicrobium sp.]HSU13760.1 S8 family serine peptidase [Longimicrobium sp.]
MQRTLLLSLAALALAACNDAQPTAVAPAGPARLATVASGPKIDAKLASALAVAAPAQQLVAIVNFDPAKTSKLAIANQVMRLGAGVMTFRNLSMLVTLGTPAQIQAMAGLGGVQSIYANRAVPTLLRESTQSLRADMAWNGGITGKGVGIAILDSGINGLNSDVAYPTKTVANVKFTLNFAYLTDDTTSLPRPGGELAVENLPNTDNTGGHGTHVAGIAAGNGGTSFGAYRGVAPGASLIGLSAGETLEIVYASVLQAVDWMIDHRVKYNIKVVNNSWGGTGDFDPTDPVIEAMKSVHDAGITVVFAAGNDGPAANTMNYLSVAPWVISVAAGCKLFVLDPTNSASQCVDATGRAPVLAGFSSRGVAGDPLLHPDVTAPGVRIVSARSSTGVVAPLGITSDLNACNIGFQNLDDFTCMSGTSMAAPHIAGVVALMQEAAGGRLTPDQVETILENTARPQPGYALWEQGTGYADAYAAVQAARAYR